MSADSSHNTFSNIIPPHPEVKVPSFQARQLGQENMMTTPISSAESFPPSTTSAYPNTFPAGTQPNDSAVDSYFPSTRRDSTSSVCSAEGQGTKQTQLPKTAITPPSSHRSHVDPLLRHYPKPTEEIDVAQALAREPRKWTLGYWMKNAKDVRSLEESQEAQAQKFAETKRQLLKAQAEMSQLTGLKR